ncbi:50S ribosomal protein L31 [bacterium]|nr:50S ribosomal protein L31 [bacterium]MBQ6436597.1 50S ribosomal protein L31 [bacterium]
MKAKIHPQWQECKVTCACGNTFVTGGTTATMQVDICNKCHPFFTGEQKFVDKEGRLDRFRKKMEASKKRREAEAKRLAEKRKREQEEKKASSTQPQTFKQILNQAKAENEKAQKAVKTVAKKAEAAKE